MKYAFYPGCALHATARPYAMSTNEIADALDVELPELEDWSCCGATVYQTLDEVSSLSLSGRNLALAEKNGSPDIVTPCAACFGVLRKADHRLTEDPDQRHQVNEALDETGLSYDGGVRVRHLLDVLIEDVGLDKIRSKVTESLDGLKVVCYYGCLMTRPPAVAGTARPEYPMTMDRLVGALGAEPLDWSYKTECCGGSFALSRPELVAKLSGRILDDARAVGAEMVVSACPLCQTNLDMNQKEAEGDPLPIVYFTELLGMAFGIPPKKLGLDKHFQDPTPLLCRARMVPGLVG